MYLAEGRNEEEDKCERRGCVKHHDRKYTCQMGAVQLHDYSLTFSESALSERIPNEIRKEYSIRGVNNTGLLQIDNEFTRQRLQLLEAKQQKNLTNERRTIMSFDQHEQQAKGW